jgi:hypothetical protein
LQKIGRNKLSEHQIQVAREAEQAGGKFFVAKDFDSFKKMVWFIIKTTEIQYAMPFKKGQTGNPDRRLNGAKNFVNQPLMEMIKTFLEDNWGIIQEDFM